jgi:hypothetical protein
MAGFRRSDHEAILECLTDDIVWRIHGLRTTRGKAEFDDEIENPAFDGSPELTVGRTAKASDVDCWNASQLPSPTRSEPSSHNDVSLQREIDTQRWR